MNERITVMGAGRMGSALAAGLFKKGFATTVWNRTASKTEALARLGLRVVPTILEAADQAEVIIVNITNYNSTTQLLRHWLPVAVSTKLGGNCEKITVVGEIELSIGAGRALPQRGFSALHPGKSKSTTSIELRRSIR